MRDNRTPLTSVIIVMVAIAIQCFCFWHMMFGNGLTLWSGIMCILGASMEFAVAWNEWRRQTNRKEDS